MRLPQSIIHSLFVRTTQFSTIGIAILLLGMMPVTAGATTPQLTAAPSSLRFGAIVVGQTETLFATVTNSGQTSVTVSAITISNPVFTASGLSLPLVLLAGQSAEVNVSFTPGALGWTGGVIKFSSNASNSVLGLELGGVGVSSQAVTASPSMMSFGQVAVGTSSTLPLVLTNTRSWKVTLSGLQTTDSGFSPSGATFPLTLGPKQSVTLNVTFAPQAAGTTAGSLISPSSALVIPLTGTGSTVSSQLVIAPAPLSFGKVTVGTTATQQMTMSASGADVTISSAASSSSQFVLDGISFPLTIPAGGNVSFNVAFTPQSGGTQSGSLSFVYSATKSPTLESLTGIGILPQHSVNLSWNSSSGVVGYYVYRSISATGTYSKINSLVDPNTAYADSTVVSGQTYYYAATSVNSTGQESARSVPVQAVVP